MALEQPFTHWPFSTANSGRPGHKQSSQRTSDRFKRYDTNESPFKDISPIPAGREFGTFPVHERQPRSAAREEITQNLNIRASQGFLAPDELPLANQFLPIPENEGVSRDNPLLQQEPAFLEDRSPSPEVEPDPHTTQEPWRGLSLMDRYRDMDRETRPVRRTNSLLQFAAFIGQVGEEPTNQKQNPPHRVPSAQQRERQKPVMTEQQSRKRMGVLQHQVYPQQNGSSRRQQNGGHISSRQHSSNRRQPNGRLNVNQQNSLTRPNNSQQPRAVPTVLPSYPTTQPINHSPLDDYPYVQRKPRRRREKRKKKNILCCGIGLVITGFIVLSGFIAAFVTVTLVSKAWPSSGLLLAGVVFGLLLTIVGFIFACHRCYSMDYADNYLPRDDKSPIVEDNMTGMHPVWQTSLQSSTLDRQATLEAMPMTAMTMTDLPLVSGDEYTGQPLEPDIIDGNLGEAIPNGSGPVPNGVPTPLAFAVPFSTAPNDYHMY